MSAATAGIGLLPTYAQWGVAASILLVLLRTGAGLLLGRRAAGRDLVRRRRPRRAARGSRSASFSSASPSAFGSPALLNLVVHASADGSRGPGLGLAHRLPRRRRLLGLVSFVLRLKLEESREFARIRAVAAASAVPIAEVVRATLVAVVVGVAVTRGNGRLQRLAVCDAGVPAADDGLRGRRLQSRSVAVALILMSFGLLFVAMAFRPSLAQGADADGSGATDRALVAVLHLRPGTEREPDSRCSPSAGIVGSICAGTVIAIAADSFPDAHPLLGCRAVVQPSVHVLQRARARRRGAARAQHRRRRDRGLLHDRLRCALVRRRSRHASLRRAHSRGLVERRPAGLTPTARDRGSLTDGTGTASPARRAATPTTCAA